MITKYNLRMNIVERKKIWKTPKLVRLNIKNTNGSDSDATGEDYGYVNVIS